MSDEFRWDNLQEQADTGNLGGMAELQPVFFLDLRELGLILGVAWDNAHFRRDRNVREECWVRVNVFGVEKEREQAFGGCP